MLIIIPLLLEVMKMKLNSFSQQCRLAGNRLLLNYSASVLGLPTEKSQDVIKDFVMEFLREKPSKGKVELHSVYDNMLEVRRSA